MWVSWRSPLPSAFITNTLLEGRQQLLAKMMWVPTGDQSGQIAPRLGPVSRCWFDPSAFITQIAETNPFLLLSKAILVPSGDHSGSMASHVVLVSRVSAPVARSIT